MTESFFTKVADFSLQIYLKKAVADVFSFEFCEFSKNTFFTEHLWATASGTWNCFFPLKDLRLWQRCFPVNFVKFLRTPFLQNTSGRLFLGRELLLSFKGSQVITFTIFFFGSWLFYILDQIILIWFSSFWCTSTVTS